MVAKTQLKAYGAFSGRRYGAFTGRTASYSFSTGAVLYFAYRGVSGRYSSSGIVSNSRQTNLRPWYPRANVPVVDERGFIKPEWDRFFNFIAETFLGGINGATVPEVADTITYSQAQAIASEAVSNALKQQAATNAQVLDAVKQVVQNAAIPGAAQLPPVQLTANEGGGDGGGGE